MTNNMMVTMPPARNQSHNGVDAVTGAAIIASVDFIAMDDAASSADCIANVSTLGIASFVLSYNANSVVKPANIILTGNIDFNAFVMLLIPLIAFGVIMTYLFASL